MTDVLVRLLLLLEGHRWHSLKLVHGLVLNRLLLWYDLWFFVLEEWWHSVVSRLVSRIVIFFQDLLSLFFEVQLIVHFHVSLGTSANRIQRTSDVRCSRGGSLDRNVGDDQDVARGPEGGALLRSGLLLLRHIIIRHSLFRSFGKEIVLPENFKRRTLVLAFLET